jgi:hypothetical protein
MTQVRRKDSLEQLTISVEDTLAGGNLVIEWGRTRDPSRVL